jgi:hypothetical protein
MQAFNIRTGERFVFDLGDGCAPTQITRLVTTYIDGTIVYVEKSEAEIGQDLNGDLDTDDCVFLLVGDTDEDGTFDDEDTCTETANPDQEDADLDGLGDVCDPNPFCGDFLPVAPPQAPSEAAADCQKTLGKAAVVYMKKRAKAHRSCLDKLAQGKLGGAPDPLCRGSFSSGSEIPPLDPKTAETLSKAAASFTQKVAKGCADADLAILGACADTVAKLPRCILPAYGAAAIAASELAYGQVGLIANPVALKCQKTVGKASVNYLFKATKALQVCLDKVNKGSLSGDAQALCLGALAPGGVAAPADESTAEKLFKAEEKLRDTIARKCEASELSMLASCGTDLMSVGDCLACTHWRRGIAAIQSAYGP